ncbi:hypothetical protein VNO80_03567 [Phaseolus coccineus]|uniref:ABC transporter domain-containing protein n=1 Tax=Phaseolus coccineus TaxID=3886 RepID=A0AAN9NTE5_PHACN
MIWEDLTVDLRASFGAQRRKLLLSGITGFAEPDRVMAIMGPSGCGKTTFLHSLTGPNMCLVRSFEIILGLFLIWFAQMILTKYDLG